MIANNIHEIAAILGPETATEDLVPVYNMLIDDVEDIRITALNHLSSFIKVSGDTMTKLCPTAYGRC